MKLIYKVRTWVVCVVLAAATTTQAQTPTTVTPGICEGVVANFNSNDNGFNSPSVYAGAFDSSFYYHAARGYWIDYFPPFRVAAPGFPRVLNIISPPYNNPNPVSTFNVGFSYIVNNPATDRFLVRIISVTQTPTGTVTNVEATSGLQNFAAWSTPVPYSDLTAPVADPTPFLTGFQGNICIRLIDPDITNGPNTTYRVEVSYLISGPFFAVFDNLSIGPINIPLPVSFIGLVANRAADNSVALKWDVTEEINVAEYRIERSENGTTFIDAGGVNAKGKSIYSFTDHPSSTGTLFYRVKSVDADGKTKYSGILRLAANASSSAGDRVLVYPSPAEDQVMVEHGKAGRGSSMTITSVDGRLLRMVNPVEGATHTPVTVTGFRPGLYLVRFDDGKGAIETVKFIKK